MSNYPVGRRPRSADLHSQLRLAALTAVVVGVLLLAAAAFVLSYEGIHQIALHAGVSPGLAKLYPLIFDAMLVIAGAAALALRGASWWARCYAWGSLLLLLVAVAVGNAVYATGTTLPAEPAQAAVAVTPWVLLLMAFGLLLEMLRHFRNARAAVAVRQAALAAGAGAGDGGQPGQAGGTADGRTGVPGAAPAGAGSTAGTADGRTAVTWAAAAGAAGVDLRSEPRAPSALEMLLGPRPGEPPPAGAAHDPGTAIGDDASHHGDPVSYGQETGYVHPDSYRDEGEYSPHGDSGGPDADAKQVGYPANHGTSNGPDPAGAPGAAGVSGVSGVSGAASEADAAGAPAAAGENGPAENGPAENGRAQNGPAGDAGPAGGQNQANGAAATAAAEPGPAGEQGQGDVTAEPAGTGDRGLERMRSTPTPPEE